MFVMGQPFDPKMVCSYEFEYRGGGDRARVHVTPRQRVGLDTQITTETTNPSPVSGRQLRINRRKTNTTWERENHASKWTDNKDYRPLS
jgi:hypothetical protein